MNLVVSIKTYNRPDQLNRLLGDLEREAKRSRVDVRVQVLDDGSTTAYPDDLPERSDLYRTTHKGHAAFWRLVNVEMELLREQDFDRALFLADDLRLVPGCLTKLETQWTGIRDPRKIALNPLCDRERRGQQQWTGVIPTRVKLDCSCGVWRTQWLDGAFYCERSLFDALGWRLEPIKERGRHLSTGVGRQMSRRLHAAGWGMYQVDPTLVTHGDHASVLHPTLRKTQPLTTA